MARLSGCVGLLFQHQGLKVLIFRSRVKGWAFFLHPREVAVTEDLCVGVIRLQTAEQSQEGPFLGRGSRIIDIAVGIEASFVTDAYRMGIVATGMGTSHLLGATPVGMPVLRDVVVIPDGLETTCQMTGLQIFDGEILCDSRRRAVNHNKINSTHGL